MISKLIKNSFIGFSFALALSSANAFALESRMDHLEKESNFTQKIYDKLASLDIHFNGDIFDLDIIDGINLSTKYRYEVEDSYKAQFFSRIDKWDLNFTVEPMDIISDNISSPVSFKLNRKTSVLFVRQFPSKKEALTAIPYSFNKLPIKAEDALTKLNTGDLVIIPAQMNILLEASTNFFPFNSDGLESGVNYQWILSGQFNIQIFKLNDNQVRLKVLTLSQRGHGPGAVVKPSFDLFGLELVDKQVKRLFNLNKDLISYNIRKNVGSQIILDYVFDLRNPKAQEAYNQILGSSYKFKDFNVLQKLNQFQKESSLNSNANSMLVSFDLAEKIALEDATKAPAEKRINRIFKGLNQYRSKDKKIAVNVVVTKWTKDSIYSLNKVTQVDEFENSTVFYNPSLIKYKNLSIGKGPFKTKEEISVNHFGLMAEATHFSHETLDLGVRYQRADKYLTKYEANQIEDVINGNIPREITKDIPFQTLSKDKKSSLIEIEFIIKAQGIRNLPLVSKSTLEKLFRDRYENELKRELINDKKSKWEFLKDFVLIPDIKRRMQIDNVAEELSELLKIKDTRPLEFLQGVVNLNNKAIFKDVGLGVVASLIPTEKLSESVYANIKIHLSKDNQINYVFGELENQTIHDQLKYIQSKINSTSYDLRLESN